MDQQFQAPPSNQTQNLPPQDFSQPNETMKPKKFGPIIAILIVILVVVIVALYLLASKVSVNVPNTDCIDGVDCLPSQSLSADNTPAAPIEVAPVDVAPITNTNDDLNSLQADLDASINGIDTQTI